MPGAAVPRRRIVRDPRAAVTSVEGLNFGDLVSQTGRGGGGRRSGRDDESRSRRGGAVTWRAAVAVSGPFEAFPPRCRLGPTRTLYETSRTVSRGSGPGAGRGQCSWLARTRRIRPRQPRRGAVASVTCRPDVDTPIPPQNCSFRRWLTVARE